MDRGYKFGVGGNLEMVPAMVHIDPKLDCTKHPPLDDLQACSESSKTSIFG